MGAVTQDYEEYAAKVAKLAMTSKDMAREATVLYAEIDRVGT